MRPTTTLVAFALTTCFLPAFAWPQAPAPALEPPLAGGDPALVDATHLRAVLHPSSCAAGRSKRGQQNADEQVQEGPLLLGVLDLCFDCADDHFGDLLDAAICAVQAAWAALRPGYGLPAAASGGEGWIVSA